jgi:subtilisin family serine protease
VQEEAGHDLNGHGTHVAGIAAGRVLGVAKAASLIDVQVLSSDGTGSWADVIAGIQWYDNLN